MRCSKAYVMLLFIMIGHHLTNAKGDGQGDGAAATPKPTMPPDPPAINATKFGEFADVSGFMDDKGRTTNYTLKARKITQKSIETVVHKKEALELPPMYIAGTYDIAEKPAVEMYKILPSLATLWQSISTDFRLVIWPPKYCHGVYVCFVDSASYSDHVKFHVTQDLCTNNGIKFYPWLNKALASNGSHTNVLYNQEMNTYFHINSTHISAQLKNSTHVKGSDYFDISKNDDDGFHLPLEGKAQDVLLLTNSRLCHAHLVTRQPMKYVPLLRDPVYKAKTDFEPSTEGNAALDGDYPYPVSGAPNPTADLLEELQNMDIKSVEALNMQFKKCSTHFESGADGVRPIYSTAPVISIIVKQMEPDNDGDKTTRSFTVSVSRCSWLRLWMPWGWKAIKDYQTGFKTEQTVDFFFDQAFMITPHSGGGIPLPGNSEVVKLIKFEFLNVHKGTLKISYGYTGKDFSYREYIKLDNSGTTGSDGYHSAWTVFMIRSEYCDAEIVSDQVKTKDVFDDNYKTQGKNKVDLTGECTYGTITEKKQQQ